MATLVLRNVKGSFLTHTEVDNNFSNLNTDKLERSNNLSDLTNATTARANLGANNASNLTTGTVATARLGSGTANNTTFLRGDNTWAAALVPSNNLSELTDLVTARSNLGANNATNLTAGTVAAARLGSGTANNTTFLRGDNTWQVVPLPSGLSAGSADTGFLQYAGTTRTVGQLYGGITAPSGTTRLNYDGNFYATNFFGNGASLTSLTAGNVVGQVSSALVAETVSAAAQPNITSLGALTALDVTGTTILQQAQERFTTISAATGTVVHNFNNGSVFVHSSISANFTANITNLPSGVGRVSIITLILQQGATARLCTGLNIGGAAQTIRWLGGTTPTPTNNAVDVQVFTIFQTGASTYLVLSQLGTYN